MKGRDIMTTDEKIKNHMREAFCEELDFGATCIFDELTPEEQDRIIGIGDDQEWGDLEDASYRGGQYNDELTDDQKTAAIRRFYESGGPSGGNWDGQTLPGIYTNYLPADTVEYYHLHDIIKARGWVRYEAGYYPPETIERMKRRDEQDRIDARDLELGRNFGHKLDQLTAQVGGIEKTATETRQGVGVLVQHLPDADKPPHIEEAEAVAIMKRKGGDMTDRTLRNWLKAGKAGRVKTPISWDDLATVASWSAWVDAYLAAETARLTRKSFISSRAGKTQAEKSRRRSPTA